MKVWKEAVIACSVIFAGALLACALNGWHAPAVGAIVGLFVGAIGLGTAVARRQYVARSEPRDYHGVMSTRAASARTLVFAAIAGLVVAAGGSYLVVLILDDWTSLVLASIVGSAWIGALPMLPMIVHRWAERKVEVGFDAIHVGSARTWLRDVERAEAREHMVVVLRRDGTQRGIPCATPKIARDFALLITERSAPMSIPPMLARAGRKLAEWRAELTSPDYRTALVSIDDAERVLLSASAARDERIGAALVLASMGARERIAEAKHSFVDASMRVALERIADDTLDDRWILFTENDDEV